MGRRARVHFDGAVYHAMARGVNGQDVFADDRDRQLFLDTVFLIARLCSAEVIAYCLMGNHFHFVIKVGNVALSSIMQRILTAYSSSFNFRHGRTGHLFQARYKAKVCLDDSYLATVIRYVHWNPVEARMAACPREWPWSSASLFAEEPNHDLTGFDPWKNEECAAKLLRPQVEEKVPMDALGARISSATDVDIVAIRSRDTVRRVVSARRLFVKEAVGAGHSLTEIAKWLGVSLMSVSRYSRETVNC